MSKKNKQNSQISVLANLREGRQLFKEMSFQIKNATRLNKEVERTINFVVCMVNPLIRDTLALRAGRDRYAVHVGNFRKINWFCVFYVWVITVRHLHPSRGQWRWPPNLVHRLWPTNFPCRGWSRLAIHGFFFVCNTRSMALKVMQLSFEVRLRWSTNSKEWPATMIMIDNTPQ